MFYLCEKGVEWFAATGVSCTFSSIDLDFEVKLGKVEGMWSFSQFSPVPFLHMG
jgi:hypothetical protein